MLFPDPAQPYSVQDDLKPDSPLPVLNDVRGAATSSSPDVQAAQFGIKESDATVGVAKAGYYPVFSIDYFYGFNANVFGFRGPEGRQNLGSVVVATATVPVWNWGATRSKVRQAELMRDQARFDLAYAQRSLQSGLNALYVEARTARTQLESLGNSLTLSAESLRLTTLRYQAGEATALEVVDAQTTLVEARNAHVDGLARYRLALAGLDILSGRL
jgi:outer membrane protein TolC